MKVAIAQVAHETNTFSTEQTDEAAFRVRSWIDGDRIINLHRGVTSYIGGMIDEAESLADCTLYPVFAAIASPSGSICATTWQDIKCRVIEGIKELAEVDAICLELHGAGVADGTDDIEGDLLYSLRLEFGNIPIVATLDLHAKLTERMVDNADMLFGVKEYPHVDMYDRGRDAIRYLDMLFRGSLKPKMSLVRLPMVIPTTTTFHGPLKDVNARCADWELNKSLIQCTLYHGFPYADSPATCVSILSIADNDLDLAKRASMDLANYVWSMKQVFAVKHLDAESGLEQALAIGGRPIIINETSDNPGAGGPGDGTHLLRTLLYRNIPGSCFGGPVVAEPKMHFS